MYNQGEILLIPIPFTDLSSQKKRPVIVLSNDKYNEGNEDIVVSAVTSNITERDYSIIIGNDDMEEGSLKVESCIRADKIYTLPQDIVINRF